MTSQDSKTCTKCGEAKPLDDFYRQADCRDGRRPNCKACFNAAVRTRREANLDLHRERDRKRYRNTPGRRSQQISTARAHYLADRERQIVLKRVYYAANPEVFERGRAKRNALMRGVEHSPYTRREIYDRDRGECRGCGMALDYGPNKFQIDHIVPISLGGPDTPANVQLMCPACNREKWANLEGQIHLPV